MAEQAYQQGAEVCHRRSGTRSSRNGSKLLCVSRTLNGFTPRVREELLKRFRSLESPNARSPIYPRPGAVGGQGLTAEKMQECRWLKPALVGQFEFVEWTPDNHLRHSRFVAL